MFYSKIYFVVKEKIRNFCKDVGTIFTKKRLLLKNVMSNYVNFKSLHYLLFIIFKISFLFRLYSLLFIIFAKKLSNKYLIK